MGRLKYFDIEGCRKRRGVLRYIILGTALVSALLVILSGCTNELIDTINRMVDFHNRTDRDVPMVLYTTPIHGQLDVFQNTKITVTFDEVMDPETINESTFIVNDGTRDVKGTVTYLGDFEMALFTPALDMLPTFYYTATLSRDIRDEIGNRLEGEAWTWRVGSSKDLSFDAATGIKSRYPPLPPENTDIALNVVVSVSFHEPIDPTSVNAKSFGLYLGSIPGTSAVSGKVSYNDASNTILFTPEALLKPGTTYTVKLGSSVSDLASNSLGAEEVWEFTTGAVSDTIPPTVKDKYPDPYAIDVGTAAEIWIDFDETGTMNPESINNKTFTLQSPTGAVAGVVVYDPELKRASFLPKDKLKYITLYTASLSGAVEDAAGNQLGSGVTWSFVTVASDTSADAVNVDIVRVAAGPKTGQLTSYMDFTNEKNQYLSGLTRYHFLVRERINSDLVQDWIDINSKALTIGTTQQAKTLALLIDTNATMAEYKYWDGYLEVIADFINNQLGTFDKVMLITFASTDKGVLNLDYFPASGPTADKKEVLEHLYKLKPTEARYAHVFDAVYRGIEALDKSRQQDADDMLGLSAVVSFAAADPRGIIPFEYDYEDCLKNSEMLEIPIYSIVMSPANAVAELSILGKESSGFFKEARDTKELREVYLKALDHMNGYLRTLHTVTWETKSGSGDLVDVGVEINYPTESEGIYSGYDQEDDYQL